MKLVYGIKDRPSFGKNLVFAFQQMIAIMAATLLVPILVSGAGLKCDPAAALFGAGAGTVVYLLFTRFKSPVFLGSSFTFLGALCTVAAQNYGYPPEEVAARTRRALQQVHIEDCADRPVYRLSGGQKKLASIAGILTLDPELILMDEPSAALDPKNRRNLIEILRSLPCAMLIASHDLDFIYDTCTRVVLLHEGSVAADGPSERILQDGDLLARCDLELPLRFQRG